MDNPITTNTTSGMSLRFRYAFAFLVLLLIVGNFLVFQAYFYEKKREFLTVAFLDIGQGDAIFIEAPNGNQMLVDAGGGVEVLYSLKKIMPFFDRSIDTIMITNPDKDHIGGFIPVLNRYNVGKVIEPGTSNPSQTYKTLESLIEKEGSEKVLAKDVSKIVLDKEHNIYFEILFPDRDVSDMTPNDGSIVGMLHYASTTILFTGDTTKLVESYLVNVASTTLDADVLKVAHHGSRTSSSLEFVKAVSPEIAVISLGKDNSYGHPHKETLQTLIGSGVEVLRTDEEGSVVLQTDGVTYWFK